MQKWNTNKLTLQMGRNILERKDVVNFLGMHTDYKPEWAENIKFINNKISSSTYAIDKVKH